MLSDLSLEPGKLKDTTRGSRSENDNMDLQVSEDTVRCCTADSSG